MFLNAPEVASLRVELFFLVSLVVVVWTVEAYPPIPMSIRLYRGEQECLYDLLKEEEYMTMSVYIASGVRMEARAMMEGPLSTQSTSQVQDLVTDLSKFERGVVDFANYKTKGEPVRYQDLDPNIEPNGNLRFVDNVSYDGGIAHSAMMNNDDDDDYRGTDYDDEYTDDDVRRERQRRVEKRTSREMKREVMDAHKRIMEGLPWEKTIRVFAAGWYRVCVRATFGDVGVELDMRKSSENGEPNDEFDGHVPVGDVAPDFYVEEPPSVENAAEEKDLDRAKETIIALHRHIVNMKRQLEDEKHQGQIHRNIGENSSRRIYSSNIMETLFFFVISAFQVYTVRKWFSGGPLLGR